MVCIAGFSIYTFSAAMWVSDRPTLFVAIALLLLLHHCYSKQFQITRINLGYVTFLTIVALLSKESGLVLPLFLLILGIERKSPRISYYLVLSVITLLYIVSHFLVLRSSPYPYDENGYLMGSFAYERLSQLPSHWQLVARSENVLKNLMAPWLPIFGGAGQLMSTEKLFENMFVWLPTILLVLLSTNKRFELSPLQKYSLWIIVLNSLVHFDVFRYRVLYVPQIAVCLFIGASPMLMSKPDRRVAVKILATILLFSGAMWVKTTIDSTYQLRYEELNIRNLATISTKYSGRIDQEIIHRVLERYRSRD
jgi:hypothetical protein